MGLNPTQPNGYTSNVPPGPKNVVFRDTQVPLNLSLTKRHMSPTLAP